MSVANDSSSCANSFYNNHNNNKVGKYFQLI